MSSVVEEKRTESDASWRLLSIVNLARLLAGVVLLVTFEIVGPTGEWGQQHPEIFRYATIALLLISVITGLVLRRKSYPLVNIAIVGSILDSILFSTLMHSSGGGGQGIGAMLLLSLCSAALILPKQMSVFAAAVAVIGLLGQHFLTDIESPALSQDYTSIGIFGILLFLSSWAVQTFGQRYRYTEDLAKQRGVDIANLSQLNDYVVQRLREGVVVLDSEGKTRLMNLSAARMLNVKESRHSYHLADISPNLYKHWQLALDAPYKYQADSLTLSELSQVIPSFIPLGHLRSDGMLMFLEDISVIQERVQQSKLAALGRLSASIAHEIRNPLAAISHAEQLLSESPELHDDDRYFTGLINKHVLRMNAIIENVLSLSRASTGKPELFDLKEWLLQFVDDFVEINKLSREQIKVHLPEHELTIPFNKSQLHQVLENIFLNALQHCGQCEDDLLLTLEAKAHHLNDRLQLSITDNGDGFENDDIDHIFEPFQSGNSQGTGLGLYISRELASLNGAILNARNSETHSALFEITFADPKRWT